MTEGDKMTEKQVEKRGPVQVSLNTPLTDLDQAWRLCEALAGSSLVPMALQGKPANILLIVMTGQELGLSVAQSLRMIYAPSSGNTQLRGSLVLAKLREAGHDWEIDQDDTSCTFTLIRGDNGRKYVGKFTMQDAVRAQLVQEHKKDDGEIEYLARSSQGKVLPWETYQPDLLFWRSVTRAVNRGAPEVMLGFSIIGAADAAETQPEVQLKPQVTPQPSAHAEVNPVAAAEGQAGLPKPDAPADALTAAQPDEVEKVRRQLEEMSALAMPPAPQPPAAAEPAAPEPEPDEPEGGPAHRKQLGALTQRFRVLGWDPKTRRQDVLDACSAFVRRSIDSAADLSLAEATALNASLASIIHRLDPGKYADALAEQVRSWENSWSEAGS
jgi:hypothetical protein